LLRYALFVLRFRVPLAILALVLVSLSIWAAPGVRLDFSVFPLLDASEESRRRVRDFDAELPPQPADVVCLLEWPEPLRRAELELLGTLTERLDAVRGVRSAVSLATTRLIETRGGVPIPRKVEDLAGEEPLLDVARRHPLVHGKLLSQDGKSAAIILVRDDDATRDEPKGSWVDRAREAILPSLPEGVSIRFIGAEIVEKAMAKHMWRDMIRSIVLEAICFVILLPLLFRSVRSVMIPLAVVGTAVLLNLGLMRLFGLSLSLIEVAIPGLITIIGLCDTIHMLHRFEEALARDPDRRAAILEMMDRVGKACLYTSLTTALGFFALLVGEHRAVRDFAVSAAVAVLVTFLCVITLLPLLLSFWPTHGKGSGGLRNLVTLGYGRRRLTIAMFSVLAAVCAVGVARIEVGARWLSELPRDEPVVEDLRWYQEHFGGFLFLDVRLEGPLDTVEAVRAVDSLERRLLEVPGVRQGESYVDWVREMIGNPEGEVGDARLQAGLLYLKLSAATASFPSHAVTGNFRKGRMRFRTEDIGTRRFLDLVRLVDAESRKLPNGIRAEVAGFSRMAHETSRLVVTTMLLSLLVSMIAISIFIMVIYESAKLGLLCVVPNGIPILAALGITGWFDIPLRIGIVMIYSLGVGLAVDNTIHLVTRYIQERRADPEGRLHDQLLRSLNTTGNALIASSAVLVLGALCYLPASFQSMSDVGILLSAMVIVALLTDVLLVPHLIEMVGGPGGRSRNSRSAGA
jgi:predicted RND superfamily exporter protein